MKLKRNTNLKNKSMTTVLFLSLLLSFLWVKDKPYSDFKKAVYEKLIIDLKKFIY